jgi:hypothetical protein
MDETEVGRIEAWVGLDVGKEDHHATDKETGMDSPATATIHVGAISIDFLVNADDSGGSVTEFECAVPADAKVPIAHSHDAFEETIYGLESLHLDDRWPGA